MGRQKLDKEDKKEPLVIWVSPREYKHVGGKEKAKEIALNSIKNYKV